MTFDIRDVELEPATKNYRWILVWAARAWLGFVATAIAAGFVVAIVASIIEQPWLAAVMFVGVGLVAATRMALMVILTGDDS